MYRQTHLDILLLIDWRHKQTHAHTDRNGPPGSLMGPPARRTVGLRVRVAGYLAASAWLGVPLVWDSVVRRSGTANPSARDEEPGSSPATR